MRVIDTSALLAVLLDERGADVVISQMRGGDLSIVNLSEALTKFAENGADFEAVHAVIASFELRVRPFEERHALEVARLRLPTKRYGLGLGDRACLAQGRISGVPILTADKKWAELDVGLDIRLIR